MICFIQAKLLKYNLEIERFMTVVNELGERNNESRRRFPNFQRGGGKRENLVYGMIATA